MKSHKMDVEDFEPWTIWRKTVFTWMMCCKYDKNINKFISRDIAIKIAKMIKVDLKNSTIILNGHEYKLDVVEAGLFIWSSTGGRGWTPCFMCLRPMISLKGGSTCMKCACSKCGMTKHTYYVVGVPVHQIEKKTLSTIYDLPNYEWVRDFGYENKKFIECGEELWLKDHKIFTTKLIIR